MDRLGVHGALPAKYTHVDEINSPTTQLGGSPMRLHVLFIWLTAFVVVASPAEPTEIYKDPIYRDPAKAREASRTEKRPVLTWVGGILESKDGLGLLEQIGRRAVHVSVTRANDGNDSYGPRVTWLGRDGKIHLIRESRISQGNDPAEEIMSSISIPGNFANHIYMTSNGVKYHTSKTTAVKDMEERRQKEKRSVHGIVWVGIDPENYASLCKELDDFVHIYARGAEGVPHGSLLFSNGEGKDEFIREDQINDHTADNIRVKLGGGKLGSGAYSKPEPAVYGTAVASAGNAAAAPQYQQRQVAAPAPAQVYQQVPQQHRQTTGGLIQVCTPEGCFMVPAQGNVAPAAQPARQYYQQPAASPYASGGGGVRVAPSGGGFGGAPIGRRG